MKSGFLTFMVVISIFLFGFGMMKYGSSRIDLRAEEARFAAAKELGFKNDEETRLRKSIALYKGLMIAGLGGLTLGLFQFDKINRKKRDQQKKSSSSNNKLLTKP
jgi:hypothetical protein